jgi:hypothetical protein
MDQIPNTPLNAELVETAITKLKAEEKQAKTETKVINAIAMKHRLFGFGALLFGAGAAVGIATAGYAWYLDRQSDLRKPAIMLSEALANALGSTVIAVKPTGTVDLDTSKAAAVTLDTRGSAVRLDTGDAVVHIVDADIRKIVDVVEHQLDRRSASPAAAQANTSLDVVKSIRSASGLDVITRWEYTKAGDSGQAQPPMQRCFVRQSSAGTGERLMEIARNERSGNRPRDLTELQFQEALRNCVWSVSGS